MGKIVCGIDIGGTKINTGLMDSSGNVINNVKVPTYASEGPDAAISRIIKSVEDVLKLSNISIKNISGIGIGSPGPLDTEKGIIRKTSNLPGWENVHIKDIIENKFKIKTTLDNDANAAALGEYLYGTGKGSKAFVYITISTGIGGGVVLDGKLYHGINSNAAEVGHTIINFDGPKCNCGNYGCLEAYASGTALAKFAKEALDNGCESMIKSIAGPDPVSAEHVFEAAKKKDKLAVKLVENEAFYLGIGMSNILAFYNPEIIAIGGGVANAWDMFIDKMLDTAEKRSLKPIYDACRIVKAELGGNVGLIGAAALAI